MIKYTKETQLDQRLEQKQMGGATRFLGRSGHLGRCEQARGRPEGGMGGGRDGADALRGGGCEGGGGVDDRVRAGSEIVTRSSQCEWTLEIPTFAHHAQYPHRSQPSPLVGRAAQKIDTGD